ncbi:hypothetical protein VTO73DRAFT_13330 [Trametes versicolor]
MRSIRDGVLPRGGLAWRRCFTSRTIGLPSCQGKGTTVLSQLGRISLTGSVTCSGRCSQPSCPPTRFTP